jgi:hypothetical protein
MAPLSNAERNKRWADRQKLAGKKIKKVVIPAKHEAEFDSMVADWLEQKRKEDEHEEPSDES